MPKGHIKLNEKVIISNLKAQGFKPIKCTELPTYTKYTVYTFISGTILANVNHVCFVENIEDYWEKI